MLLRIVLNRTRRVLVRLAPIAPAIVPQTAENYGVSDSVGVGRQAQEGPVPSNESDRDKAARVRSMRA